MAREGTRDRLDGAGRSSSSARTSTAPASSSATARAAAWRRWPARRALPGRRRAARPGCPCRPRSSSRPSSPPAVASSTSWPPCARGWPAGAEADTARGLRGLDGAAARSTEGPPTWTSTWTRSTRRSHGRVEAMIWLVRAVGPVSSVPLSIDSSDAVVLEAGLDAIDPAWAGGAGRWSTRPPSSGRTCSSSAAQRGTPVVLSCTGPSMPSGTQDRLDRAEEIIGLALAKGLPRTSLYVDALIIPIGVDPFAGTRLSRRRARHPRALRPRHPRHRRHLQRLLRPAGATPRERRLPRPLRPGRARQRHRRPGGRRHRALPWRPTATRRPTGWRPPCSPARMPSAWPSSRPSGQADSRTREAA